MSLGNLGTLEEIWAGLGGLEEMLVLWGSLGALEEILVLWGDFWMPWRKCWCPGGSGCPGGNAGALGGLGALEGNPGGLEVMIPWRKSGGSGGSKRNAGALEEMLVPGGDRVLCGSGCSAALLGRGSAPKTDTKPSNTE